MELTVTNHGELTVVTVEASRIDSSIAVAFKDQMREATAGLTGRIILELSKVDFIDSSGLGAVVASLKQLETGAKLDLAGLTPTVAKVFQLTRMDTVFDIHGTLDAALTANVNVA